MITLRNKLYESLLDDEELINSNDEEIVSDYLDEKFLKEYFPNSKDIDKNLIKLNGNSLEFNNPEGLYIGFSKKYTPIKEYFPRVDHLKVKNDLNIWVHDNYRSFDDQVVCENIEANNIRIILDKADSIEDMNFKINNIGSINDIEIIKHNPGILYLKDINVEFAKKTNPTIMIESTDIPIFDKTKFNAKNIKLKLDLKKEGENQFIKKIEDLIDTSYKFNIFNNRKGIVETKRSNFKNIYQSVKNKNLNELSSESNELFKFNSQYKINDIFNNLPKYINYIEIVYDFYVTFIFEYDPQGIIKQRLNNISQSLNDGWNMRVIQTSK